MEEPKKENKLFNVFLLGDIKSEKNKLIQQYILNNNNKENIESEVGDKSNMTQSFEIHGETIKINILEDQNTFQALSSEKENSPEAQGILLFYNVEDNESFEQLKQIISKIIDMNKYEMPIVLVGNNLEESQRKVSFEEAKNLSDKYGLKYHEISVENKNSILNEIFKDLGEQVLYQEILDKNKIKEIKSKAKVDIKEKKTLLQKKREDEVREKRIKREKEMELLYKKKEREGI